MANGACMPFRCVQVRPISHIRAHAGLAAPADAGMPRKRVQLSDLDLNNICQLAVEHQNLSQDKLKGLTVLADNPHVYG